MKTQSPIVGMHFRPPAKAILASLPASAPLRLAREPENEYDPFAIQIWARTSSIPETQYPDLENLAVGFGFSLVDILARSEWQLGYIASKPPKGMPQGCALAPDLAPKLDARMGTEPTASLTFDGSGKPLVEITW